MQGWATLALLVGLYFIPSAVALSRDVSSKWSVVIINLFLGWTLVGWVAALAMAARTVNRPAADSTHQLPPG